MRKSTTLSAGFLTIQVDPTVVTNPARPERGSGRKITRAEAVELHPAGERVGTGRPEVNTLDQIGSRSNLEVVLVDRPSRDERPDPAMITRDTGRTGKLIVHQHRERAVAVVIGAEPVGNADHPVRRPSRRIPHRQDRPRGNAGWYPNRNHIRARRARRTGLGLRSRHRSSGHHPTTATLSSTKTRSLLTKVPPS